MARLGKHQLCLLATLASPFMLLVVSDKLSRSLVQRGLLEPRRPPIKGDKDDGGFFGITPAGLRALADALERGNVEQFFDEKFERDRVRLYMSGRKSG